MFFDGDMLDKLGVDMPKLGDEMMLVAKVKATSVSASERMDDDSLEEASNEARFANLYYDQARRATLQGFDWGFARRRRSLATLSGDLPKVWTYKYAYPADCLRFRYIQDPTQRATNAPIAFQIENDGTRRMILTDVEDAVGVYTMDVTNGDLFPPLFVDALAWHLAWLLSTPVTRDQQMRELAANNYNFMMQQAMSDSGNEGQRDPDPESTFEAARH